MHSLFIILFIASLGLMIWGLIAPHHFAQHAKNNAFSRKDAGVGFGLFVLVFLILASVTMPPSKQPVNVNLSAAKSSPVAPVVTIAQVNETQPVAFKTSNQDDSNLAQGQTQTVQTGKDGVETLTYTVTYTDGKQTSKTLTNTIVTTQPVDQIVHVGTYVAPAPAPVVAPTPTPQPSQPTGCYPLTNGGNCYEPGEYCRVTDHNVSGLAGDGKAITCLDNNGWRWEPV